MPKRDFFGGRCSGYKNNVMLSINWVVGWITLLFGSGVVHGPSLWIRIASFVLLVMVTVAYFGIYIYWMLYDSDRLQSEGYNLELVRGLSDTKDPKIKVKNKKTTVDVPDQS